MILKTQTLSYTSFTTLIFVVIAACFIILFSSGGQSVGKENLSWKEYVDRDHGFSLRVPSNRQGTIHTFQPFEPQDGLVIQAQTLNPCTNSSDYLKDILPVFPGLMTEHLGNNRLDGFVVLDWHLDNITPGPEAYIFNCPYLIRIGLNSNDFPNPDTLFRQIVGSVKIWSPDKNSRI